MLFFLSSFYLTNFYTRTHRRRHSPTDAPLGFGSGWDIILPAKWGMAFWLSLHYAGARPTALREKRSLAFEQVCLKCLHCINIFKT